MQLFLLFVLCACCAVQAFPYVAVPLEYEPLDETIFVLPEHDPTAHTELSRIRRQLNVQGGGSPKQGFDLSVNGRAPVWTSDNGKHSFDVTGGYSQHLGGPYGNSRPNFNGGGVYTYRW